MEEYPREVQATHPLLLAALVGATSIHPELTDALHTAAVNACSQRRFKYLSSSYDMRILPAKRGGRDSPNYRWEGVLKRSWLEKMCSTIPAVLVLCIDWSEELNQPEQEESQALHYLQHARRQAKERDLRLVLFVLLHPQTMDPQAVVPPALYSGDGMVVVVGREELTAKAPALERLIYDNAMAFYSDEEKRLRKPWTPLKTPSPSMQAAMQVRSHFKVAFLNEFRKNARASLTSYVKAYELLLKDSEVIDVLERMDLCNHIALRMYQRYFFSHDVGAAVHHCRIHVNSLRKHCPRGREHVWRKWHWLSLNHQIFGDLLDSTMQRVPLLLNSGDVWQFPGFHFQVAAVYARRLREWALRCLEPGHLPADTSAGGPVLPSPFLGQAGRLERPNEVTSPRDAVALRLAHEEAGKHKEHAERSLKLLIRSQAAAKERNLGAWISAQQIRVAEAYLCDQSSSHQEAARDLFQRLTKQPSNCSWGPFRRFFLERSILCSCSQLRIRVPALCSSTRAVPATLEEAQQSMPNSDELRSTLVRDAFEYLSLKMVPAWSDRRQGEELLEVICRAAEPLPPQSIEIVLPVGRVTPDLLDYALTFDSSDLPLPLELASCMMCTEKGDEGPLPLDVRTWEVSQPLTLKAVPVANVSVRFTWAACAAVVFVGEGKASKANAVGDLQLKLPGAHEAGLPERLLPKWQRWNSEMISMKSELLFPVDPSKALVSDTFLLLLALHFPAAHFAGTTSELRLTATVQVEETPTTADTEKTAAAGTPLESSKAPRVSTIGSESMELVLLGDESQLLAEVANGQLRPAPGVLSFKPGDVQKSGYKDAFAWPIAVQCGRACKITVNFTLTSAKGAISRLAAVLTFQHAMKLQISEERMQSALSLRRPVSFSLKSITGAVQTTSVEVDSTKCLGTPGPMANGSAHAFLWPPGMMEERPRLKVEFQRHKAVEAFFAWIHVSKRPAKVPGGGVAEWLLPEAAPAAAAMSVELEVNSTGSVGSPLKVQVLLKNATFSEEEIKVRILQESEVACDRYLLSGPVSFQAAVPNGSAAETQIPPFALIPLKAGWMSLPRVQVHWGNQDAISSSRNVFVSPGAVAVHRTAA